MSKIKHLLKYPLIIIFFVFILGFTVADIIEPDKHSSEFENNLEQKPIPSIDTIFDNSFGKSYETYINEQFIFRNNWIDIKAETEMLIGKLENNGIVFGDEKYLFEIINEIEERDQNRLNQNVGFMKEFINCHLHP